MKKYNKCDNLLVFTEEELNELMDRSDMAHDNSAGTRKFTY